MTMNSSATARQETPHSTNNLTNSTNNTASSLNNTASPDQITDGPSRDLSVNQLKEATAEYIASQRPISRTIKRRAQALIKSRRTDPDTRALLRYALEIEDPWRPELVRRVDAGKDIMLDFSQSPDARDSSEEKLTLISPRSG